MNRPHRLPCIAFAIAAIVLIAVMPYAAGYADFRKTIARILWERWFDPHSTTWQHGVLVPFVVGWLVWKKRHALARAPLDGSITGLFVTVLAMLSYFVGYKASNYYFGFLAIQTFALGAVLWLFGFEWMKQLRFPWLLLGFMWPLVFLEDRIGFPLRMISTNGVMCIASALHAPIVARGTSLFSASAGKEPGSWMTLQVDGPCSGMNTLFALLFVGAIYSWMVQRSNMRRLVLFTCCIPLALMGNMIRICLLITGCALFGQDFAVGNDKNEMTTYHLLSGLLVFPILVLGLQFISKQMNRRSLDGQSGGHRNEARSANLTPSTIP